ncbi:MAG TPA: DNA topoisomerase (ATP-hydrolyzing) subunit B [Candidatus Micrarchaeota archaeon]|nr:DNA topoisomerase (ATP-hydrolyzing) subunit B [Candidatus Micrarchaeota archaeon]
MSEYTASDIQILEGLEAVRKRPAMYIGDTGIAGLHHLVYEIVDNSIDEATGGYCNRISVTINADNSIKVSDNGRGIPVDKHPKTGRSALEVVMSTLHAGGKFDSKVYKASGGLHGVGMSVVNALSEHLDAYVDRDGKKYHIRCEYGKPVTEVTVVGEATGTGTTIVFKPDPKIFSETVYTFELLANRLRELAFLNKGVAISLEDLRNNTREEYKYDGGIVSFVEFINKNKEALHKPIYFSGSSGDVAVEIAMQYTATFSDNIYTFANNINTHEGGFHLVGFKAGLTRCINDYAFEHKLLKEKEERLSGDDIKEGLTAIISVKIINPQFEGQTKTKLGNSEVKGVVESAVFDKLKTYLEENPNEARRVIDKCVSAAQAREAAQKAKDLIRRKNVLEGSLLPGKLADCIEEDPTKTELFIVEGDSAGGSAKQGRDRKIQAILPLRGKILNVEKAQINRVLASEEIRNLITAMGTNFGVDFSLARLRYHKIVIMTDADVDGAHIRTLLLTLFYRHMKPLIEGGHIYAAMPPLFKVKKGKVEKYVYTEAQLATAQAEMGMDSSVQRYKGLGEMNPQQLWDTTMDPSQRTLVQITVQDAIKADELFTILMGEVVEPRRAFIEAHAKDVKNLDV